MSTNDTCPLDSDDLLGGWPPAGLPFSEGEVIMRLTPSMPRRLIASGSMAGLGLMAGWIAFQGGVPLGWMVVLLAMTAGALWLANEIYRVTGRSVELMADRLQDSSGRILAMLDEVEKADRSPFAVKPSSGFNLRITRAAARARRGAWVPGLWWRVGRHVGIGGATPKAQARLMADLISHYLKVTESKP